MDAEELSGVQDMLVTRSNKKMLQDHILKKTGKVLTLRDLTNIKAKLKPKPASLEEILQGLQSSEGIVSACVASIPFRACNLNTLQSVTCSNY